MKTRKHGKYAPKSTDSQYVEFNTQQNTQFVNVAILGCGEVGGAVYYALNVQKLLPNVRITRISVQNPQKNRSIDINGEKVKLEIPSKLFCTSVEILKDNAIDIVVDATAADITGTIVEAMTAGKHIVSANKALIGRKGSELEAKATLAGVGLLMEACVQGKIPVLRAAQYHLPLKPYAISALLSGTCGFILAEVEKNPATTIAQALTEAQRLKYAETDPTADVEAFDATAKAKILARAYFNAPTLNSSVDPNILRVGILNVPSFAFKFAAAFQHRIQLVGTIEETMGKIGIVVMPTLVPKKSFIGSLYGVTNGLEIHEKVGPPSEYAGPGAGGAATAAAILGDLATVASAIKAGNVPTIFSPLKDAIPIASFDDVNIRPVFLSASPENEPGIFRAKLSVIESNGLSVEQVLNDSSFVELSGDSYDAIVCKKAPVSLVLKARIALEALPCVHTKVNLMRVLGNQPFSY